MTVITLGEVIQLAKLGAHLARESAKKGVHHWLGSLPTAEQLDKAQEVMAAELPPTWLPPEQRVLYRED